MKHRSATLLCLLLLLLALPYTQASQAESIFHQSALVEVGFNPSSMLPVSDGVPIFTQGDNVWVESQANYSIQVGLVSPDGSNTTGLRELGPGQLIVLYTFGRSDPAGIWTLDIASSNSTSGPTSILLSVVTPDSSLVPSHVGDNLTGNMLNQAFAVPPTGAYDVQACSMGAGMGPAADFGVSGLPNGTLTVTLSQNATLTFAQTKVTLTAWLELYSQYSYQVSGATSSRDVLVASSPVFTIGGSAGPDAAFSLAGQTPLRSGRYDLRVFERTASGLSLQEAQFLRAEDGSWLSLRGCTSLVTVNSHEFTLSTNMDRSTTTWPRRLVTMYALNGVDSYSVSNLTNAESVVHLHDLPNGASLTGVTITASAAGGQLRAWDAYNSAVYALMNSYPSSLSIGISFSGVETRTLNATIAGPFSSGSLAVQAGSLGASTTLNGETFPNATISVAPMGGNPVVIPSTGNGSISILLPPDSYTVTATYGGNSFSEDVNVVAGHNTTISLELNPPGFPVALAVLAAIGGVALLVNVIVWRRYLERRKVSI